jgi:hypothetical protein
MDGGSNSLETIASNVRESPQATDTNQNQPEDSKDDDTADTSSSLVPGAIAGIAIGSVVAVAAALAAGIILYRRK